MADYKYIQVALSGQFDGEVKTVYSYPSAEGIAAWENTLFDPSTVIKNFLNARECYVMWQNGGGHYYALITRNPMDQRSGYIMLTLAIADGYALTGKQITNALMGLKKTLIEDGSTYDDAVGRCLESLGISSAGMRLQSWAYKASDKTPDGLCYRTYVSGQELDTILSFPSQPDYERYQRVIVIPATASLRAGVRIDRITAPVKKVYTVIAPEGVTPSKTVIADGERLTLTFTKEGFNSRKETVVAGAPSPYVRYEGAAIRVKKPQDCGVGFVRKVKLNVRSAKGGNVNGYTINVNGRPINTMEPYIELREVDIKPGATTEISVASNNFRPLKVVKPSSELAEMEELTLSLEPLEQGIILRLDFGEGRIFQQEISIERNTPEYSQLHSGNFHGFRAQRQGLPGGAGEIYNVDVRAASRPSAPVFVNATAPTPQPSERKVPHFENIANGSSSSTSSSASASMPGTDKSEKSDEKPRERKGKKITEMISGRGGMLIGAIAAIIVLVVLLKVIIPSGSDKEDVDVRETTTFSQDSDAIKEAAAKSVTEATERIKEATVDNNKPADQASAPGSPADEQADLDYLNKNDMSWKKDQLKSPKYNALIMAISIGDIEQVINNDYFAVKGNCSNKRANEFADIIWKIKGTKNETIIVDIMKNSVKADGTLNLFELWDKVSRKIPTEYNKTPRPQK